MLQRFSDSSDDLARLCRTSVVDSIDGGAGGGGSSGSAVAADGGADDMEGLKRKHEELLSETKKSKAAAREAQAREAQVAQEAAELKARLDKLEKEKLTDQERQARAGEEALARARKLEIDLEVERKGRAKDRAVADAIRAGVIGDDAQEFVASKLLSAQDKDPALDRDAFMAALRAKSPAFFSKAEADDKEPEEEPEPSAPVLKGTAGGHESPRGAPSKAQLQVAFEKAKADYQANPRDSLIVYRYVEAKKALER